MNRRAFLTTVAGATAAAGLGTGIYSFGFERLDVQTHHVRVALGLAKPLRAAVLGDIHFDPLYEEDYLHGIMGTVSALKPDLVLFTGDFVTGSNKRIDDLARILSTAKSRLGSFACLGNHDHWNGPDKITTALDAQGIRVLRNESMAVPGEENLFLSGLESFWSGRPDLTAFKRTPAESRHVMLLHEPDPFAEMKDSRIKLQLAGHTHGGQVRLPLVGALLLPKLGRNFQEGLYARGGRQLYVNRGVGTLFPHCRFDCRPEITVLELT